MQSGYPLVLALLNKGLNMEIEYVNPNVAPYYNFSTFSASWMAIFEFFKLVSLSMKKDLRVFMKMGFLGASCVISMIIFVIIYGFISIDSTSYDFKVTS